MSNDDNALTQTQRIQRSLAAAVKSITRAYQMAEEDAEAVGFRNRHGRYAEASSRSSSIVCDSCHGDGCSACGGSGTVEASSVSDPTSDMALRAHYAPVWLNEVVKAVAALERLGYRADKNWPAPLVTGDEHGGVKVGQRANTVELCAHCSKPAPAVVLANGRSSIVRVDGKPYHRTTCYYQVYRSRAS